jgi:hypothetical protein
LAGWPSGKSYQFHDRHKEKEKSWDTKRKNSQQEEHLGKFIGKTTNIKKESQEELTIFDILYKVIEPLLIPF